ETEGAAAPFSIRLAVLAEHVDALRLADDGLAGRVGGDVGALVEHEHVGQAEAAGELLVRLQNVGGGAGYGVPAFLLDARRAIARCDADAAKHPLVADRADDRARRSLGG